MNEAYEAGYKEFCKNKFNVSQKLYEEWDINNVYVECNGEYSITLKANNPLLIYDAIKELLENNPFIKTNEIEKYYSNILNKMITEDRMIIVFQVIIIFLFVKIITII